MYSITVTGELNKSNGLTRLSDEEYKVLFKEAEEKNTCFKMNTGLPLNEGMWAIAIDEESDRIQKDNSSTGEKFKAVLANDSVCAPPFCTGTIIQLISQGKNRPILDLDAMAEEVMQTLPTVDLRKILTEGE